MYRVLVSIPLFQSPTLRPRAQIIASMSAAVVNLILIMALGRVYENLAKKMTEWGESFLMLCMLGKNFSWQIFKYFFVFLIFTENGVWHFIQSVSLGVSLHGNV